MFKIIKNFFVGSQCTNSASAANQAVKITTEVADAAPPATQHHLTSVTTSVVVQEETQIPVSRPTENDKLPGPAEPKEMTQQEIDEALRATPEWKHSVQAGHQSWEQKMDALMERIKTLQSEEGADGTIMLMMLAAYYHLDFSNSDVLKPKFTQALRLRIERDLDVGSYRAYIEEKTRTRWNSYPRTVDFYVEEFLSLRPAFLEGFTHMVDTLPHMMDVANSMYDELKGAENEYRPERGGDSLLRFRGFVTRLAQERLPGVTPSDFFPENVPRYIRDHYAGHIKTSGFLLLWAMMGVIKTMVRRSNGTSTSEIGIEFEKRLISEISEVFPTASIEPTPVTGDQGADVVLKVHGIKIVIQAKRYTGVVGNSAVQEVFAAQQFYEADYAMVVTTSRYTSSAQTLAQKIGVELTTTEDYLRRIQQFLV